MSRRDFSNILSPPAKRNLGEEVVETIRDAILDGRLAPGERLTEESLASSMNVSRGPIREALVQLEREGLVVVQRNRGAFVARLSRIDLDEVYSLRLALERLAVQLAARNADPEQLNEMQAIVNKMAELYARGITEQQAGQLDTRFHDVLCQASKHKRLYKCWSNLRPQILLFLLSRNVAHKDFRENAISSHQGILDAIREKDEERSIALIEDHIREAYKRIVAGYTQRSDYIEPGSQVADSADLKL